MKKLIALVLLVVSNAAFSQVGDLVFCFDVSGSMRFPLVLAGGAAGTCADMLPLSDTTIRYQNMFDALLPTLNFLNNWYGAPADATMRTASAQIGCVHFPEANTADHHISLNRALNAMAGNPFPSMISTYFPYTLVGAVETFNPAGLGITVGCSAYGTPLGPALQHVLDDVLIPNDNPAPLNSDNQVVILVSDGEPNYGTDPNDLLTPFWTQPGNAQNKTYRKVFAVGIGDDDHHYQYLNTLATNTGGQFYGWWKNQGDGIYGPLPAGTLSAATSFSSGGSLWSNHFEYPIFRSLLHYRTMIDPIDFAGPNATNRHPFQLTPLDTSVIITAKWPKRPTSQLKISLLSPNGVEIKPDSAYDREKISITAGSYYIYFLLSNKLIRENYGNWQIRVRGDRTLSTFYNYSIFTRADLEVESHLERMNFNTGDILNGPIRVRYNGEPVALDSARAYIVPPVTWLGNWLADEKQSLSAEQLRFLRRDNWMPDVSLIERKRILLNAQQLAFQRQYADSRLSVTLADDGNHLDGFGNDGVYNNAFLRLTTPGVHEILYSIYGKTAAGHAFRRELYFQKFVGVAVDTGASIVEFRELERGNKLVTAEMTMNFRDKNQNAVLPQNRNLIKIDFGHAESVNGIQDLVNGTYTQKFQYDRNKGRPQIGLAYETAVFPAKRILFTKDVWRHRYDLLMSAGTIAFDSKIALHNSRGASGALGIYLNERLRLESAVGISVVKDLLATEGILIDAGLGLTYDLLKNKRTTPFILGGGKYLKSFSLSTNDESVALAYGAGVKLSLRGPLGFFIEGTDIVASGFFDGAVTHNRQIRAGVIITAARKTPVTY